MENTKRGTKTTSAKKKSRRINRAFRTVGKFLVGIQILLTLVFLAFIWRLGMIPTKYVAGLAAILLIFAGLLFTLQVVTRGKAIVSKLISILMSAVLVFGSVYLFRTHNAVQDISGDSLGKQVDSMLVAVRSNDPAEKVKDTADYIYGLQHAEDGSDVDKAMEKVNQEIGAEVMTAEYKTLSEQAGALLDGNVQAIVYNEGFSGLLDEVYDNFQGQVKIIAQYSIESEGDTDTVIQGKAAEVNVKNETFNFYISGIDVYGPVSTKSRSDVNILATVNPETKQILLTNTPRDYYVEIPGISQGSKDKLTHAGIYGVDKSMATLEQLYDVEIPFYARVNFTSLITLVDAMGGVDVESEYAFTTNGDGGAVMSVQQGLNHFNGKQALAFSRERYSLAGGDNQRGKNQMAVIKAMFEKMISPEMLIKAPDLISQVSDSVETNMSMEQIQNLIQSQLNSGGGWTIKTMAAEGTGDSQYCYSMPTTALYVMQPNQESVDSIKAQIKAVENGEMLTE
ncbi:MAG TPA: LCP family protein [Candidatus Blautia pullicola]|jgi:LCP family protein required for cell wall assembly|uniref:LCP family protein n=1 Tax=Candidatus Blautia pullicola TaxID=2838498 RepID=A0A9D2FRA8_9FIRM|nr:LCP family protein [Candidatus Blautia pullicola]